MLPDYRSQSIPDLVYCYWRIQNVSVIYEQELQGLCAPGRQGCGTRLQGLSHLVAGFGGAWIGEGGWGLQSSPGAAARSEQLLTSSLLN